MSSYPTSTATVKEILCIEHHGELCLLLSKMLARREFRFSYEKDTGEASKFLRMKQPALVLIEDNFFEDTGIRHIAQLKAAFPATKVIMLSAQDGKTKQSAKNAGVDVFLTKPFTKTDLLNSVIFLIDGSDKA
jgi:DNA-binding response OmpR family regulator